jgi:inner membrane protein
VIFLLLRAEDNALLIGAITSFLVVAATMYLTRKIDWYSPLPVPSAAEPRTPPPVSEPSA